MTRQERLEELRAELEEANESGDLETRLELAQAIAELEKRMECHTGTWIAPPKIGGKK